MKYIAAALALATSLFAGHASAQNLVSNPGFETGAAPWSSVWGIYESPHSGDEAAGTGCGGDACLDATNGAYIFQDIPTTVGASYTLTFWYRMDNEDPVTELQALVSNGAPTSGGARTCTGSCVFQTMTPVTAWTEASRTFVATSTTTRITFLGRNDPAGLYLDDVAVVAAVVAPVAAIPTMSEWAMILLGLILAGGAALYIQHRHLLLA